MAKDFKINAARSLIQAAQEQQPAKQPKETASAKADQVKIVYIKQESKTKRVQLLVRPSTLEQAKAAADKMGISINELINQALEKFIKEN